MKRNHLSPDRSSRALSPAATPDLPRRRFVQGLVAGGVMVGLAPLAAPAWGRPDSTATGSAPILKGTEFDLVIAESPVNFTGKPRMATTINGSIPAPTLHMREGDEITIRVTNRLREATSIHWHGIILPFGMDGVPGISFAGIPPGETFVYRFTLEQAGTYWYHSHSGMQEQTGMYGAIVIAPRDGERIRADRDYVVQLSDWTDEDPMRVFGKLKTQGDYYNFNQPTVVDFFRDVADNGLRAAFKKRQMWNEMRMSPTDLADLSAETLTYLMNGTAPAGNWTALFQAGERVRLRFINGAGNTFYDVRIPGLKMSVVQADGVDVEPVTVDEFRFGPGQTYDVIVEPEAEAYTLFAQAMDRTGYARGTLASRAGLSAAVPALDPPQQLTMEDMMGAMDHSAMSGMDHGAKPEMDHAAMMNHAGAGAGTTNHAGAGAGTTNHAGAGAGTMNHATGANAMDHGATGRAAMNPGAMDHAATGAAAMDHGAMGPGAMDHGAMDHGAMNAGAAPAGGGLAKASTEVRHARTEYGPSVDMRVDTPRTNLDDPGVGLRGNGRKVLTLADLRTLGGPLDPRPPEREIELHLTGNMERYTWSFDGLEFGSSTPVHLKYGERVRVILHNDTMMTHPMHLHGMWSELESPDGAFLARLHTIPVQPAQRISFLVTADARGRWAWHCHLMFHMDAGMFREVVVS